ncbi:MAG: hypothetical protein LBF50_04790 [Azoarcus sp.]|jgi:hypothetical protein|nr:hypothetical protein [Azoarcus sp.]
MLKRWESAIYRNNHIKASCYHIIVMMLCGIPALYGILLLYTSVIPGTLSIFAMFRYFLVLLLLLLLFLLPCFLAIGCWFKLELARKISEFTFVAMAVGFPFCSYMAAPIALLALFLFLPATLWKDPDAGQPIGG